VRWKEIQESPMSRTNIAKMSSLGTEPIKTEDNNPKPDFEQR